MNILTAAAVLILIALDQWSKYWALHTLQEAGSIPVIENVFHFTFVMNTGAAFGFMQDSPWARTFFLLFTAVILCVMFWYYLRLPKTRLNRLIRLTLALIAAGAIGNAVDRLRFGYVVDFLHAVLIDFPVFNLADVYVVTGTFCLGVILLFFVKSDEEEEKDEMDVPLDLTEKSNETGR